MKEKLLKKIKKQNGFTLVEMLIVVAIIAILVVVSFPIVNSSLEKSRVAADAANERSAKALASIKYLEGEIDFGTPAADKTYHYNVDKGTLEDGAATADDNGYGQCSDHKGEYINVTISSDGTIALAWTDGALHGTDVTP